MTLQSQGWMNTDEWCVVLNVQRRVSMKHESVLYSSIAQLVERTAVNRVVVGSSPTRGAKNL